MEVELRQNLKNRAELQGLAFFEFDFIHFGAGYGNELLFVESLLKIFRHERLNHFALNVIGKTASHQRDGRLAGTKSGDARDSRNVTRDFLGGFLNVLSRNFQFNFALAGSFSHRKFFLGNFLA